MGRGTAMIGAAVVLAFGAAPAAAATLTVNTTTDELNAGDHLCSLREAIDEANIPGVASDCAKATNGAPNTIVLGPHTYTLSIGPASGPDDNESGDLTIFANHTLTIQGAGTAKTTIDATGLADRALTVVTGAFGKLKDLTVTGGHPSDGSSGQTGADAPTGTSNGGTGDNGTDGEPGGGIENDGTLTLNDVRITGNHAGNGGLGGMGGLGGYGFTGNVPAAGGTGGNGGRGGAGGGIYDTGTLRVIGAMISNNFAGDGGPGGTGGTSEGYGFQGGPGGNGGCCGDGGGIAIVGSHASLTLTASTVAANHAGTGGDGGRGGTYPQYFSNANHNQYQGGNGGNGTGGSWGGGISNRNGSVTLVNSTIEGNFAGTGGGAGLGGSSMGCSQPPPECGPFSDGAFGSFGVGGDGGGVRISSPSQASLLNTTVALNGAGTDDFHTPAQGGGIWEQGSPVTLTNTLLASNAPGGNCDTDSGTVASEFLNGGHDLSFGDTSCPSVFLSGDPKLGPLQNNGGLAPTMDLLAGSAARNRVTATGAHCPGLDQRGVHRPAGTKCDIGAYEWARATISLRPVSHLTQSSATVTEIIRPNQVEANYHFEFGTTTKYALKTSLQKLTGGAVPASPKSVSAHLTGLRRNTLYHYRVVVSTADGMTVGGDQTFRTPS